MMRVGTIRTIFKRAGVMLLLLGAASAVGYLLRFLGLPETNIAIVYLLSVLLTTLLLPGYAFGFLVSVLSAFAFNFLFTEPYFTFTANATSYIVTFVIMTITSFVASTLASNVQLSARRAQESEKEAKALYELTNRLTGAVTMDEIADIAVEAIGDAVCGRAVCLCFDEQDSPKKPFSPPPPAGEISGGAPTAPAAAESRDFEILGKETVLGVIRLPLEAVRSISREQASVLRSMIESIALAMDRLRAAEQRSRLREETSRERYRSNLLRSISHDLRTPLSGILGTSEILQGMTEPSDARYQLIGDVRRDAVWLRSLVENVLSLTRLQDGDLAINKQPEAVEEVVSSAVSLISRRYPRYDIAANVPDALFWVPMDARLIIQVLVNLLENAVKHTSAPGEISVTVTEDRPGRLAVFSVKDNGCGIDPGDLPYIFQMFYTSKTRHGDARMGTGLGLAICDAIIKAHGGTAAARNRRDGAGAEFIFTLPMGGQTHEQLS